MDSSMCSSAPDPEMWIIQGTLAWRTPPVRTGFETKLLLRRIDGAIQLSLEHRFRFSLNGKIKWSTLTTHLHRPRTTEITPFILGYGGIIPFEPFFLDSKSEMGAGYFLKTCQGKEEGEQAHLESAVQRRISGSSPGWPSCARKRIEEASDYFMHAHPAPGGYSSVGRAPLLQLGRCDYGLDFESAALPRFPHLRPLGKRIKLALANSLMLSPFNPFERNAAKEKEGKIMDRPHHLPPRRNYEITQGRLRHQGVTDRS
ncbi:hypothetical protein HAX54_033069 [Datura stramonium]|uniref:Uncharacterized protein n=1 Tax=Datura stramonium TaxID=4076 RepID=A0ABS8VER3_DATST|nr:hypothetical protein [Datura stramonium]